jgi:hypothetical protein
MGQGETLLTDEGTSTDKLKAIYISAELSAPARQLPLAINTAIPTIVLCFITANAAYYILLPWSVVSITDSVAVVSCPHTPYPSFLTPTLQDRYNPPDRPSRRHRSRNTSLPRSSRLPAWKLLRRWPHDRSSSKQILASLLSLPRRPIYF